MVAVRNYSVFYKGRSPHSSIAVTVFTCKQSARIQRCTKYKMRAGVLECLLRAQALFQILTHLVLMS